MARQTTADAMSQAMLSNVIEKLSGNDLNDVVKEAKNYINMFESGKKKVKEGFGGTLGMLYILQALALRVMSDEKNDTSIRQKSEEKIKKALAMADKQGEEDQEFANKLIEIIQTPEKADRSLIKQFLDASMTPTKATRKSSSNISFLPPLNHKTQLLIHNSQVLTSSGLATFFTVGRNRYKSTHLISIWFSTLPMAGGDLSRK